jgi:hypothetical protein
MCEKKGFACSQTSPLVSGLCHAADEKRTQRKRAKSESETEIESRCMQHPSPPAPRGARGVAYRIVHLPTPNAFLNLGITAFVVFLVARWLTGREYEAYLASTLYSIIYLGVLLWVTPQIARE